MHNAALLNQWLETNKSRISHRFEIERIGDWSNAESQGITLDLYGTSVASRLTLWPETVADTKTPFADIEIINVETGETISSECFVEFNAMLLNRRLDEIEKNA
ncbi:MULTISPECIES: hypothetical protein [Mesorhizobium]|uniref:Uncharacterized protein n=1 Tax=Mesorhizobium denitrificans TaxID=2294114 RepID=A0A371XGI9_9HYPH|nr:MULTISPECIES: hypothetical protein [Mesorhizobium]RFC68349.1 hypothetical protein DY251_05035 [Mesorhizobium denitrificans]